MIAISDDYVLPRAPWSGLVPARSTIEIIDLGGNQAVDCIFYLASDTAERYSAAETLTWQGSIFLREGSVLRSDSGRPLLTVVSDGVGRHDTIGGACSKESNALRYGYHTYGQHACVENFLAEGARWGLGKRDLVSNINWFMNVPVEESGMLGIVDGISAPGMSVRLVAHENVLTLISNCPQVNNPCNGFDPTPIRVVLESP